VPGVNQFYVTDDEGDRLYRWTVLVQPGLLLLVGVSLALWRRRS
jgi:hypothetical protein